MMDVTKDLRQKLYRFCEEYVSARIAGAEQAIANAREAANDDTKSSAGDKYETTREMMQQEIARYTHLLLDSRKMRQQLELAMLAPTGNRIGQGSLVETTQGTFFLAIAVGAVQLEDGRYFVVSPHSPLGKIMVGKFIDDSFSFNGLTYSVLSLS